MTSRHRAAVALALLSLTLPAIASAQGWTTILDAKATGWRGYQQKTLPDGWKVIDGALTRVGKAGDIVYGAAQYGDFELEFEFKVQAKGNSGLFYRASEATEHIYENAAEFQVLDNVGHPDGRTPLTVAGSDYALYGMPSDAVKPAGEWNQGRVVVRGAHVEHWLNGKHIAVELWSPDWEARVKASKFHEWPSYGRAKQGLIGLQDHGDWVAFRNIRVKKLG